MLGKYPEDRREPESDLKRMINIYLEEPFGSTVSGVGIQNGHAADDFHIFKSTAKFDWAHAYETCTVSAKTSWDHPASEDHSAREDHSCELLG